MPSSCGIMFNGTKAGKNSSSINFVKILLLCSHAVQATHWDTAQENFSGDCVSFTCLSSAALPWPQHPLVKSAERKKIFLQEHFLYSENMCKIWNCKTTTATITSLKAVVKKSAQKEKEMIEETKTLGYQFLVINGNNLRKSGI